MSIYLFTQGAFGQNISTMLNKHGLNHAVYTKSIAKTRTVQSATYLRDGYPFRYINEEIYDSGLIPIGAQDVVLTAGWEHGFFAHSEISARVVDIHPSLLPLYSGTGAISAQFLAGIAISGVSLHNQYTKNIIDSKAFQVEFTDYPEEFLCKATECATALVLDYNNGKIKSNNACMGLNIGSSSGRYRRTDGIIDLNCNAIGVYNKIRAFAKPFFGTRLVLADKEMIIWRAICEKWSGKYGIPGAILDLNPYGVEIACGDGTIMLTEVEFEGKLYKNQDIGQLIQ